MLQTIENLPDGVLGFEAGEIHSSDYRDVLMPAVQAGWERGDEVRIVLVFERWDGCRPARRGKTSSSAWNTSRSGSASPS